MSILIAFSLAVLRVSAVASSVCISAVLAGSLSDSRSGTLQKQALGFAALFLMSLLVYLVV